MENKSTKLLVTAIMLPIQTQRQELLAQLDEADLEAGLELVHEMLAKATVLQRPALKDLIQRLLELGGEESLMKLFRSAMSEEDFPRKHLAWFANELDMFVDMEDFTHLLQIPDADSVLPLIFRFVNNGLWHQTIGDIANQNQDQRVRLWAQYLTDYDNGRDRLRGPFPLLELDNLEDPYVEEWIDRQLSRGFYDSNILWVCIEREDNRFFERLWAAIWSEPKHKELSLRALTVTAPHVPTPVQTLLERVIEPMNAEKRRNIVNTLAQSFSRVVFIRAQEFCQSPNIEHRLIGIDILTYFGSPWHNSRDACVECLLQALNDPEKEVRRHAVQALASSERRRLKQINPMRHFDTNSTDKLDETWKSLVQEVYRSPEYTSIRESLWGEIKQPSSPAKTVKNESDAHYRAQTLGITTTSNPSQSTPKGSTELQPPQLSKTRSKVIFSSPLAYLAIIPVITLAGAILYGVMPRETSTVPTVMSNPLAGGSSPVMPKQFFDEDAQSTDRTDRSKAELEGAMQLPHEKILLERSNCWYLYHRLRPIDAGQFIANGPVPQSLDDPTWKMYDTWLLTFIDDEIGKGIFGRVGEFVMTIATINPALANQLVPKILDSAGMMARDNVAEALVKGGAIDLQKPVVHPAITNLDGAIRLELRDALLSGWKTNDERALAQYLGKLAR